MRVSEKTARQLARTGDLPAQKAGREWRFLRRALEDWLASGPRRPTGGTTQAGTPSYQTDSLFRPGDMPKAKAGFSDSAFTENRGQPMHRWVPWIAGFSGTFVSDVLDKVAEDGRRTVLDPFAGVGTTLVEGMRRGFDAVGFEINPYAALACRVKLEAPGFDVRYLRERGAALTEFVAERTADDNAAPSTKPPQRFKSRVPFYSPSVERQVLFALDGIAQEPDEWVADFLRVALGATMVAYSNYSYEPSLCRRAVAGKEDVHDSDVAGILAAKLDEMWTDVAHVQAELAEMGSHPSAKVWPESYLTGGGRIRERTIDVLVTSPPYLNNYHYVRNTRPQMYWLGLVADNAELKAMEQASFGKFWQTVRSGPVVELNMDYPELADIVLALAERNPEKGVYGGRGWANYAATYFNDCERFCRQTLRLMKPGGLVVVVIGNNILQGLELRTDEFFAGIAERCGFEVVGLHRVRKKRTGSSIVNSSVRVGTVKRRTELYETAVELRTPAK